MSSRNGRGVLHIKYPPAMALGKDRNAYLTESPELPPLPSYTRGLCHTGDGMAQGNIDKTFF